MAAQEDALTDLDDAAIYKMSRFAIYLLFSGMTEWISLVLGIGDQLIGQILSYIGASLDIIAAYYLMRSLHDLSRLDAQRFSRPARLSVLLLVAFVILLPVIVLGNIDVQFLDQQTFQPASYYLPGIIAYVGLAAVVGIVGLVGFAGSILGLWRVGKRYRNPMFRVGALLFIFPYANVLGSFLMLTGIHSNRRKSEMPPAEAQ